MIDEKGLLPCPFCGAPGAITALRNMYWGYCSNDDCAAEVSGKRTRALAMAEWNRRALPASGGEGVVVKPLKWRPIGPIGSDVEAETPIGTYAMSFDAPTAGGATNLWVAGADVDTFSVHEKRRDAEAAAQADYEARVLSALSLQQGEVEPVAWRAKSYSRDGWAYGATAAEACERSCLNNEEVTERLEPLYAAPHHGSEP